MRVVCSLQSSLSHQVTQAPLSRYSVGQAFSQNNSTNIGQLLVGFRRARHDSLRREEALKLWVDRHRCTNKIYNAKQEACRAGAIAYAGYMDVRNVLRSSCVPRKAVLFCGLSSKITLPFSILAFMEPPAHGTVLRVVGLNNAFLSFV